MMNRLSLSLLFLLLGSLISKAQYSDHRGRNLDSLENVVATWTPERLAGASDEVKDQVGFAFSSLAEGYQKINADRSLYCARRALDILGERGHLYQACSAANRIGIRFYQQEEYDSAAFYMNLALGFADRMAAGEPGPNKLKGNLLQESQGSIRSASISSIPE